MNKHTPASVTAVKGHFITKSSPLATDSCKLDKQFITAQNLASHYKRIINAKSSIDMSPPKSLVTSQKARDRARREMLRFSLANKNLERAKSAESARNVISESDKSESNTVTQSRSTKSAQYELDKIIKPRVLPDQNKLNKSMSNMLSNFTKHHGNRVLVYKPSYQEPEPEPENKILESKSEFINPNTSRSERSVKQALTTILLNATNTDSSLNNSPALKAMSKLVSGHSYDVLENHSHKFKQPEKEFQPRIKNLGSSVSKLKESNFYQPPRRRKRSDLSQSQVHSEISTARESQFGSEDEFEKENPKIKKTIKLNQEAEKEEEKKYREFIKDVTDDIKTRGITSNEVKNKCFEYHINKNRDILDEKKMRNLLENLMNGSVSSNKNLEASQTSLKRTAEKEEEIKYREFIKDVTDDIKTRGITSNEVKNKCFEYHINKNRDKLDEKKMRSLLKDLMNNSVSSNKILDTSQTSLKRTAEKEEEIKYLEFIKDVTDDIISRGITSNRVINNCFEYHVKKNRDKLDEKKMRNLLENLREDIGIPNEDETEIDANYYQTINKAILLDKQKNKENLDNNLNTEYLTLRKFGIKNNNQNLNLSKQETIIEFENQIINNINSIRRNSLESQERIESNNTSRKNSTESVKSIQQKGSILKKSNSQSDQSRKNSQDFDVKQELIKNYSDEDDDDLFSGSRKLSDTGKTSKFMKDDDNLFNDDYGDPESEDESKNKYKSVDYQEEEEDEADDFENLLQTKKFSRRISVDRSTETPTPKPKPRGLKVANDQETDDDHDDF